MDVTYRLFEDSSYDHQSVVEVAKAIRPDDLISVEGMIDWDAMQAKAGRIHRRWLASVEGRTVGSAVYGQSPWLDPDYWYVNTMVHPDHRGRGIGRGLFERVEASAA